MEQDFGTVTFNGKTYTLTQEAYIDNYRDDVAYFAHATDEEGNDYLVRWSVLESYDMADEDDANAYIKQFADPDVQRRELDNFNH